MLTPDSTFEAVTSPVGVHARTLPGTDQAEVILVPDVRVGGVGIAFDAWCHHDPKGGEDKTLFRFDNANVEDRRWFRVVGWFGKAWIAAAGMAGNPPGSMNPIADPSLLAPAPAPPVIEAPPLPAVPAAPPAAEPEKPVDDTAKADPALEAVLKAQEALAAASVALAEAFKHLSPPKVS